MGWDLIISEPLWCGDKIWHRMFCRPIAGKTGCNTECEPISKSFNIRKTRWGSLRCIRFLNLPSDKQLQLFSGASLHPSTGAQASADEQATLRVHKKRLGRQWWSDDEEGQKLAMNKKILVVGRANIDSCLVFDRHHSLILPRAKFKQYTVVIFWPDWLALSICTWKFWEANSNRSILRMRQSILGTAWEVEGLESGSVSRKRRGILCAWSPNKMALFHSAGQRFSNFPDLTLLKSWFP